MLDLISGGRLEMGLGSGAYQREFDRMKPGLQQPDSWRYMQEMLPLVRALWQGDVEHEGERSPITFDYAVENDCNIMCWPLTLPISEAEKYKSQLDDAIAKSKSGPWNRTFALMRHTAVYENEADRNASITAIRNVLGKFGNLMTKKGDVVNGFADSVPLSELDGNVRVDPAMLEENLMFGDTQTIINKLDRYEGDIRKMYRLVCHFIFERTFQ